jgi:phage baseplate assembly protein W
MTMETVHGADLSVVPGFAAHDAAVVDLVRRPVIRRTDPVAESWDLAVVSGRENLAQALVLRLLTPRGTLAALGHTEYGSRLHELIGREKSDQLRSLCRAFVLEAVAQEARVAVITDFAFDREQETPSSYSFTIAVLPRHDAVAVGLSLEVTL